MAGTDKKTITRSRILNYVINNQITSKAEVSKNLNLSMPTVLSNINDLIAKGIIIETGEYESTGGRKAKSIGINPSYRYSVGIVITANHVGIVLVNLKYEIVKFRRVRMKFSPDASYCQDLSVLTSEFLKDTEYQDRILGIGISIPGIISQKAHLLIKSHALQLENYSLSFLEQAFDLPVYFENDANAAMMAEDMNKYKNAIYLSLNNTLGGAFCIGGKLFQGENQKAGEFGHMILVPGGRKCYCGKKGCADAYCAASALTDEINSLETFMEQLKSGDEAAEEKWSEYLDMLAVLISNLRMAYDMDIILGGEVGGYLAEHMLPLGEKVMEYNGFDHDIRYLRNCSYKREASAVGAAKHFLQDFIKNIE
ncbi:ROK family transcriptional regulator [Blautia sp. OM07-19]|jgi:predicted NBD/HSP70 family sugar kinase|uniref:ROK family transcriptional regulator n=1 Tax=unclassified Blautia TaxID=2648079 RepID=UPI000E47E099|nr:MULTISPECIES: ROK family transcriptional regulator [unclassified Blautia]RGG63842.1 ROK family transcriptional regulator [Blautia sp. AF19-10LB]RHV04728.1 ROK family transcriptional regulator [Blautia sp. OM07-19]